MQAAHDIMDRLADPNPPGGAALGTVTGGSVTIFNGALPDEPDDCFAVRDLPGGAPVRGFGASGVAAKMETPDVQIFIRKSTRQAADAAVALVRAKVDWFQGTINGRVYHLIHLAYDAIYMGKDENNRHTYSLVFHVKRA